MSNRILLASPVRQKPQILECFLHSLRALRKEGLNISYYFIDDNEDDHSSQLLSDFASSGFGAVFVEKGQPRFNFVRDEVTHRWTNELVWHVASYKNKIISYALAHGFNYLFLVDSDLVLHPNTLIQLVGAGKDIISEIFWTKWEPDLPELPQVWACDHYTLYEVAPGERLAPEAARTRQQQWLNKLRRPGIYKVGGLGACTLISRRVLEKGVDFSPLYNLSFWGEDRHFCVRAVACGFELFVDTHYPAFHIYRDTDLSGAYAYMSEHGIINPPDPSPPCTTEVLEVARQALRCYGTTKCYQDDLYAGLEYFAQELREAIYRERAESQRKIRTGELVTYAEASNIRLKELAGTNATVLAKVKNFGVQGKHNFLNEFTASMQLRKEDNRWVVAAVDFRPVDLARPPKMLAWGRRVTKHEANRITLAMVVRNEAERYLAPVLDQARRIVDAAVIIDDGSTDGTPELIEKMLGDLPLVLVRNKKPLFERNESKLRQMLWNETIKTNPDWILCLDADELFEDKAVHEIREMVNHPDFDYYSFRIYDFWDELHYREEPLWSAHFRYYVLLVRYRPDFKYVWNENPLHCGRFPLNVTVLPGIQSPLRVKHLGWMNPHDRLKKYLRYRRLNPEGRWGVREQYESILDPFPRLVRWRD